MIIVFMLLTPSNQIFLKEVNSKLNFYFLKMLMYAREVKVVMGASLIVL